MTINWNYFFARLFAFQIFLADRIKLNLINNSFQSYYSLNENNETEIQTELVVYRGDCQAIYPQYSAPTIKICLKELSNQKMCGYRGQIPVT